MAYNGFQSPNTERMRGVGEAQAALCGAAVTEC